MEIVLKQYSKKIMMMLFNQKHDYSNIYSKKSRNKLFNVNNDYSIL